MKRADASLFPPLIILAGGKSSRFGSPKGLAQLNGHSLLAAHISSFSACGERIAVIAGTYATEYAGEVERIRRDPESQCSIECVVNEDPDRGPFSSVQTGLLRLANAIGQGVFIQPVDAGPVPASLFVQMKEASRAGRLTVVPVFEGKGGHPVLLSAELARRCLELDAACAEARLDMILRAEPADGIVRLSVTESAILNNFNRPADLPAPQRFS